MQMINWVSVRDQFPILKDWVYLNAASISPVPITVSNEGKKYYEELKNYSSEAWDNWEEKKETCRKRVAKLLSADKSEIAFMDNTSSGLNLVAQMLKGQGGVLTMKDEFPATTIPWIWQNYMVKFINPQNNKYPIGLIDSNKDKDSKILITSHVQYKTGFRQNLEKVGKWCKENGVIFIVNATQSFGAMPINVKKANVDFLVFNGVKWGVSGGGAAALYLNRKWLKKAKFPIAGCESVKDWEAMDNQHFEIRREASALEVGSPAFAGILAMGAATELLLKLGINNIQQRIYELNDYLTKEISNLGLEIVSPLGHQYRSGITVLRIRNAKKVVEDLQRRRIAVSARGDGMRVSLHFYNNKTDIDALIDGLKEIMSN